MRCSCLRLTRAPFIRRFRAESRLVSEAEYLYTNMVSAAQFVELINPDRLSIDKDVFLAHMIAAGVPMGHIQSGVDSVNNGNKTSNPVMSSSSEQHKLLSVPDKAPASTPALSRSKVAANLAAISAADLPDLVKKKTYQELEMEGSRLVAEAARRGELSSYRFLYSQVGG